MTGAGGAERPQPNPARPHGGPALPLLAWLGPQVAALAATTSRVPLWAKYPATGEDFAFATVLCAQVVGSALLFPLLLRDRLTAVMVIGSAWPMTLIAGAISSVPVELVVRSAVYLSAWLITLAAWTVVLRPPIFHLPAVAVATALAFAHPLVLYLNADFGEASGAVAVPFSPLLFVLPAAHGPHHASWILLIILTIAAAGVRLKSRLCR